MQMQLTLVATSPNEVKYLSGLLEMISNTDAAASLTTVVEAKALPAKKEKAAKEEPKSKKKKAPIEVEEDDEEDEEDDEDDTDAVDDDDDEEADEEDETDDEDDEDEEETPPVKKGRGRPAKAVTLPKAAEPAAKGKVKLDDVIEAFAALAESKGGRAKGQKLLTEYGVKSSRGIKESQWADALKKIKKLQG